MLFVFVLFIAISNSLPPIPCTNTNPAGCLIVNINYTRTWSTTCPCMTCQTGLAIADNGISCCLASVANCYQCSSSYNCVTCVGTYGFNSSSICVLCILFITNCNYCSTISAGCTSCMAQFSINQTGNICVPCTNYMPYCRYCSSSRVACSDCNTTIYAVNTGVTPNRCELCNRTLSECLTCKNSNYCYSCTSDRYALVYYNSNQQYCYLCSDLMLGCETCYDRQYCYSCTSDRYALIYYNSNYQYCYLCSDLMLGCETCYDRKYCKTCKSNATYYNFSIRRCQYCNKALPNCKACTTFYNCLACQDKTYSLTPFLGNTDMNVCILCLALMMECLYCTSQFQCTMCQYGRVTRFGCTKIPGCSEVNSSLSVDENCLKCATHSFLADGVDGKCICTEGWVVGQFCTTIHGCVGLSIINNQKQCVACNSTSHFKYLNHTCVCKQHYHFTNFICAQICGDGYLHQLECDDGNLVDGDGCSSLCEVQTHFGCVNTLGVMPASKCKYRGLVQVIPEGIYKIPNSNSVELSFFIQPYHPIFTRMNLTKSVNFSLQNTVLQSSQISNGMMTIIIDFSDNIQGKLAQILISYDQEYVKSPNFKAKIPMIQSTGLQLKYEQFSSNSSGQDQIIFIISYCSIVCLLLGSVIYRMMGVETIQTIQIIFLLMATEPDYQITLKRYDGLGLAYGILPSYYEPTRGMKNPFYTNLGYDIDLKYNYSTIAYVQLSAIMLYLVVKMVVICIYSHRADTEEMAEQSKDYKIKQQYQNQLKKMNFHLDRLITVEGYIYNLLLFPILAGFSFHLLNMLLAHILYGSNQSRSYFFMGCIVSICIFVSNAICSEFLNLFTKIRQKGSILRQNHIKYPSVYLFHTFFIFTIPYLMQIIDFDHFYEIGAALIFVYLIWVIIYRPYMSLIDNLAIIVNELAILFTFVWFILKKFNFFNDFIEGIFEKTIVGFMGVVIIVSLVRVIVNLKDIIVKNRGNKIQQKEQQSKQNKISIKFSKQLSNITFQYFNIMKRFANQQRAKQKSYKFNPFQDQVQAKEKLLSAKKLYRKKFQQRMFEGE